MQFEGFRGTPEDLKKKFNLNRRLQIRVGALLAKKIQCSFLFLESLQKGSLEEKFLLHSELIQKISQITEKNIAGFWDDSTTCPLQIIEQKNGWKLILYEEELLAKKGFESLHSDGDSTSLVPEKQVDFFLSPISYGQEQEHSKAIFSKEELEKLRLHILTSADANLKIEALRKLTLSSLSKREKGLLFLQAILDQQAEVREEAALALSSLGLSVEITECIKSFSSEKSSGKIFSLERLSKYLDQADSLEMAISFYFLSKLLEEEVEDYVFLNLCSVLKKIILKISKEDLLLELSRKLIRILSQKPDSYELYFQELFKTIASCCSPENYSKFLHYELEMTTHIPVQSFLLLLLNHLDLGEAKYRGEQLAHLLIKLKGNDGRRYRIGKGLVFLGKHAVSPLMNCYHKAGDGNKAYIIQLLDAIVKQVPTEDLVVQIVSFLLDLMEGENSLLRQVIYETQILKNPLFPSSWKRKIAETLIGKMSHFVTWQFQGHMEDIFSNLGEPAVTPLIHFMDSTIEDRLRDLALLYLGATLSTLPKDSAEIENMDSYLQPLFQKSYISQEILWTTTAKFYSSLAMTSEKVEIFGERILEKLQEEEDWDYNAIRALGILGTSPYLSSKLAEQMALFFLNFLHQKPPENIPFEKDNQGIYHHDDEESSYFTELLPVTLVGLKNLAMSPILSPKLTSQILQELLKKFRELQSWKVFWGPYNEAKLAQVLVEISLAKKIIPLQKVQILKTLKKHVDKIYILKFLGELFEENSDVEELGEVSAEIVYILLKKKKNQKKFPKEIQNDVHHILGILGKHHYLGGKKFNGSRLREAITGLLFEGIGRRISGLEVHLENIAHCPSTTEALKEKILSRLSKLRQLRKYRI